MKKTSLTSQRLCPAKGIRPCERKAPKSGSKNKSLFTNETTPQTNKGDANSNASGIRKGLSANWHPARCAGPWTLEHRFHLHCQ